MTLSREQGSGQWLLRACGAPGAFSSVSAEVNGIMGVELWGGLGMGWGVVLLAMASLSEADLLTCGHLLKIAF